MTELPFNLLFLYTPYGDCSWWQTPLVLLHASSDSLMAIAYFLIFSSVIYFVNQREEVIFRNILVLFSAFLIASGIAHLLDVWTLWYSIQLISGIFKAAAALISIYAAFYLIPLIPRALSIPSLEKLESTNQQLCKKVAELKKTETEIQNTNTNLARQLQEKAAILTQTKVENQELQKSTKFKQKITDLTPNFLYIYDLEENRYVYCNRQIGELLGYSTNENNRTKRSLFDKLHPADIQQIEQHRQNLLSLEDDRCLEIEYRLRNRLGTWHWLHSIDTIFERHANGKPKQVLRITQNITRSKEIQLELKTLNLQLRQKIRALEASNQERIKLGKINEFLQASLTLEEARKVLADLLRPLFPNADGAVYLINNSKTFVEAIATWGTVDSDPNFAVQECWALRRSNTHQCETTFPGVCCGHVRVDSKNSFQSMCLPMMAQGETLGLLYLSWHNANHVNESIKKESAIEPTKNDFYEFSGDDFTAGISHSVRELGETVAQNIAMALANIKLQETLRYQSLRDPLTGLYNRRYLEEYLAKEIDRASRRQHYIGVMVLDIDYFKRFNDTYGHEAGDLVLRTVSQYLRKQTRQYDIACRYGGEELVAILPEASMEDMVVRAEGIREGIKSLKLMYDGQHLGTVSVSIGISCFPDDGLEPDTLIKAADKAMYRAKQQGRDRVARC